jgi:DNA polymerase-3 subunit epsilon
MGAKNYFVVTIIAAGICLAGLTDLRAQKIEMRDLLKPYDAVTKQPSLPKIIYGNPPSGSPTTKGDTEQPKAESAPSAERAVGQPSPTNNASPAISAPLDADQTASFDSRLYLLIGLLVAAAVFGVGRSLLHKQDVPPISLPRQPEEEIATPPKAVAPLPAQPLPREIVTAPQAAIRLPDKVLFVDVETTGVNDKDRVVSLAAILVETSGLGTNACNVSLLNIICDPGRNSHPGAREVHGLSDWLLRHQEPLAAHVDAFLSLFREADLIVAHNANFDISFIEREASLAGKQLPQKAIYCTMEAHRRRATGQSASLGAVAARIGLARAGRGHGALEDAWLAMMIYLDQQGCPHQIPFANLPSEFANLRPAPPQPEGPLPRRTRKSRALPQTSP